MDAVWFNWSLEAGIECLIEGMKDIHVSIVLLAGYQKKVIPMIYDVTEELVLDPWKVILPVSIQHIMFCSVRKDNLLMII